MVDAKRGSKMRVQKTKTETGSGDTVMAEP